ncbi:MAG: MBL fold metallo-hydrolase, partial [Acidobacteriia bacterium]|nr:MBL fold metallo-hydrolase [Terriglobia bacterium]
GQTTSPVPKAYSCALIRDGLYWITDGAYNTMFLVTRDGVVAVDAPPTLGENYLKAIREVTDKPINYLIYSHEHTDHIGGASLFPKSAKIIAQEETAAILKRRNDPRRPLPAITFRDRYTLRTGGEEIQLIYPGPNHQTGNILIWAPRQKTLMVVDVIYPGYMPYKNLGIVEDVPGYIAVHRTVLGFAFDTFIGGHVGKLGTRKDVEASLDFTNQLYSLASRELAETPFPAFLKLQKSPDKWDLHNEYEKTLVDRCAAELGPVWEKRLADTSTYLKDNCWAMIEAITVQMSPSNPR